MMVADNSTVSLISYMFNISLFSDDDDDDNPHLWENQFVLPWWRVLLWTILFVAMVVVSIGGNLIVVWIVLTDRQMRTVTNYFLVNFSIADTILATFTIIFNYSYMMYNDWPYGRIYCNISQFIAIISICASVFTLAAISVERYMAIIYPLKPRMRKATTIFIIIAIWLVSLLLAIPNMLYSTTFELRGREETRILCYLKWPDGAISLHGYQDYVYNVLLTTLTYFLPICAMGYAYLIVGMKLWGSQGIGESVDRQMENIKSKRRVVKMLMVVVTIFVICWLPQNLYFMIGFHFQEINDWAHIQEIYLGMYWLAMSNSIFRNGFLQVFYWWFRCCRPVSSNDDHSHQQHVIVFTLTERPAFVPPLRAHQPSFRVENGRHVLENAGRTMMANTIA